MKRFLYLLITLLFLLAFNPLAHAQDAGAPDASVAPDAAKDIVGVKPPLEIVGDQDAGLDAGEVVENAQGEDPVVTEKTITEDVGLLIRAAKNGQWSLFAGIMIMILIFIANKAGLKEKVGPKALPWICVLLGVLSSIGVMLVSGIAVDEAIAQGIVAGLVATGGWELIFKQLLGDKAKA